MTRVLYTDIDGTLVGPLGNLFWDEHRRWTTVTADALVRAHRAGLEIVALSGRRAVDLDDLGRMLGLPGWIAEMGGVRVSERGARVVVDEGAYGSTPDARAGLSAYELLRPAMAELIAAHPGRLAEHAPWNEGRRVSVMVRGLLDIAAIDAWLVDRGLGWAHVVENGVIPRRYDDLPDVDEVHVYHLTPRGVSKRDAIVADQRDRGLDADACGMVGDAFADLACADAVATCFLVRNAVERDDHLRAAVETTANAVVTRGAYGDGFAEAVDAMLS